MLKCVRSFVIHEFNLPPLEHCLEEFWTMSIYRREDLPCVPTIPIFCPTWLHHAFLECSTLLFHHRWGKPSPFLSSFGVYFPSDGVSVTSF